MTDLRAVRIAIVAACALAVPLELHAAEYETFIDVDDEDDLYDLYTTGEISEGTFTALTDVLRSGVDLQTATREDLYALPNLTYDDVDRILRYRKEAGRIGDPATLVSAGVLTQRKLAAIAAFVIVEPQAARRAPVDGHVRYQTVYMPPDPRAPPMVLQARVNTLRHLSLGATGALSRNRLGEVTWDPNRQALVAEPEQVRPRLPKYFVAWETPEWGIVAGTYRIGFGQRLVFDNSGRYTPNGFYRDDTFIRRYKSTVRCKRSQGEIEGEPCDDEDLYTAPDYYFREGLRGLAVGAKHLSLPVGWLQAYGFFSHQTHQIYQYAVHNGALCPSPALGEEDDARCGAPDVYVKQDDPLAPAPEVSYQTLPNMFDTITGGGNFSWFYDRRTHVGVTGYGAAVRWLVDDPGADLDFKDWARWPYGGPFGALGADMAWGYKWADISAEFARSFDGERAPGEGGFAGILRHTATWDAHEIEVSGRWYDKAYNNPYARPIASADQLDGLRARDEAGGRLRYSGMIADRLQLRTFFDVWTAPSLAKPQVNFYVRGDVRATEWFRPGVWVQVQDRNLGRKGRSGDCFYSFDSSSSSDGEASVSASGSVIDDVTDDGRLSCDGERVAIRPRLRFDPHRRVWLMLQYQHELIDDPSYPDRFRQDATAYFTLSTSPVDPLRIRTRVRYLFEDIADNTHLEQSWWWFIDVSWRIRPWMVPRIRYDIIARVDDRASTALRRPNPEHWLMFELSSRF